MLGLAGAGAHPAGPAGAASATSFSRRIGTEARSSRLKPLLQGHVLRFRRDSGRLHLPPARPPPPKEPHAPPLPPARRLHRPTIGTTSGRERGGTSGVDSVVDVSFTKQP